MSYSGTGIRVDVKDAAGQHVRTDSVAWGNLTQFSNVTTDGARKTWTYTIPDGDQDHAYSYTISYTTVADFTGKTSNTTVSNSATSSFGGHGTGHSEGVGAGGEVKVEK